MKRVIKKDMVCITRDISDVTEDRCYGITTLENKGFIRRESYPSGTFLAHCCKNFSRGTRWDAFKAYDIKDMIDIILDNINFSVFEFDTPTELFEWLSK